MDSIIIISLCLLALVIVDATGDALRFTGHQIAHHSMEVLHVAGWFAIWALFGFEWLYIPVYILGRIWLFDLLFNVLTGHNLLYMGKNDLFGRITIWFAGLVKQRYEHFSFMVKFLALIVWIGLILKANGISI